MHTPSVCHFTTVYALRRNSNFAAAKAGDLVAARRVARAFVDTHRFAGLDKNIILCQVTAVEKEGVNLIPLSMAQLIAKDTGLRIESELVQTNLTHHTDSTALHRLLTRPEFEGPVKKGATYMIIDDVVTTASTVQALRLYLERHGAIVKGFVFLAGSYSPVNGSSLVIDQTAETRAAIEGKFGTENLDVLLQYHGIAESASDLTNIQAQYLLSFKSLDTLGAKLSGHIIPGHFGQDSQLSLAFG